MAHRVVSANQQLSALIRVLAPHTLYVGGGPRDPNS